MRYGFLNRVTIGSSLKPSDIQGTWWGDREHQDWAEADAHERRRNPRPATVDRSACSRFSAAGDVIDVPIRVLCVARPEEQLAASSTEGGVRSGAPEQEDMHEHSVPDAANELAENV